MTWGSDDIGKADDEDRKQCKSRLSVADDFTIESHSKWDIQRLSIAKFEIFLKLSYLLFLGIFDQVSDKFLYARPTWDPHQSLSSDVWECSRLFLSQDFRPCKECRWAWNLAPLWSHEYCKSKRKRYFLTLTDMFNLIYFAFYRNFNI